jgi:phosphate transport system substrate-binding protein
LVGIFLLALASGLAGCGGDEGGGQQQESGRGGTGGSSARISIEGSSTVFPITQSVAEAFDEENPDVNITVGGSGTGDGFEAFCRGETQISDASRPIKAREALACDQNGIEFIEIPVARDGVTVVVNPRNHFAENVALEELGTLWSPDAEGQVDSWNDVDPEWPEEEISLYGPGPESGTFDFFTSRINGKEGESRTDYQASEDDNVLVQDVASDPDALGYFGFGYFEKNQQRLKALTVNGIAPTAETVDTGEYPLSRPLFIYVSAQTLHKNPALEEFGGFYLDDANLDRFVEGAAYVPLWGGAAGEARRQFEDRTVGTVFEDGELPEGQTLEEALRESS